MLVFLFVRTPKTDIEVEVKDGLGQLEDCSILEFDERNEQLMLVEHRHSMPSRCNQ